MAVSAALTGAGWLLTAPIPLIPGAVQLRILAFLPAVFGVLFGPRVGFVSGAFGTIIWALLGGYFNPATPTLDLVGVGLWGAIPGYFYTLDDASGTVGLAKVTAVSTVACLIGLPFSALGFQLVGIAPFWAAMTTLIPADVPAVVVGTPLALSAIGPVLDERNLVPTERY
jgi:energy-coupling factor transport system substrate-specific component